MKILPGADLAETQAADRVAPFSLRFTGAVAARSVQIRRVLAAVDNSDCAEQVVAYAYAVAGENSVVRLIHIVAPWAPMIGEGGQPVSALTEEEHAALPLLAERHLRALVPDEAEGRRITTEIAVLEGDNTAKIICQEAENFAADIVCVGAHGNSRLAQILLGSVSRKVMSCCHRPVLIVRNNQLQANHGQSTVS